MGEVFVRIGPHPKFLRLRIPPQIAEGVLVLDGVYEVMSAEQSPTDFLPVFYGPRLDGNAAFCDHTELRRLKAFILILPDTDNPEVVPFVLDLQEVVVLR